MSKVDRVVVTGGAGLIGSHLVEQLVRRGTRVIVYDDFSRGRREYLEEAAAGDPEVIEGDIRASDRISEVVRGADAVVHLAALFRRVAQQDPRRGLEVNVGGTLNVLEACVKGEVGRLVFASTASVYGEGAETAYPTSEDHPFRAEYFDGAFKVAGEQLLKAFHKQHGLQFVALRYANVYGPRQPFLDSPGDVIMALLNRIESGEPPVLDGDGSQSLDLVHANDAARAAVLALEAPAGREFLNIGSGRETTLKELALRLIDQTVGTQGMQPVFRPRDPGAIPRTFLDSQRARDVLGFQASTPLGEGIASVLAWRKTWRSRQGCAE